jgi:hypothetical protein
MELKEEATPYHARSFPIPRVHEQTIRQDVEHFNEISILNKVIRSEWAAPTFNHP